MLRVRLRGPGVRDGRILLADLVRFGQHLQTAVNRIAAVLEGEATSVRPGRPPDRIRNATALEVVAIECGSFQLALDLRRDQEPLFGMDPGKEAVRKLLEGMGALGRADAPAPVGYDAGVQAAIRDVGIVFDRDIEAVEFEMRTEGSPVTATYDATGRDRLVERIRTPVQNQRTVEGRLLMADFLDSRTRCRVHPPTGAPVDCEFDESLASLVQENLRGMVRVSGEAVEDADTGRVHKLKLVAIEPLGAGPAEGRIDADAFWRSPTIEQLAAEQEVAVPQPLETVIGAGADLWSSDDEFDRFMVAVEAGRASGRAGKGGN